MEIVSIIDFGCGNLCIVLPMSVVTKDVQSNTMVDGLLAMIIRRVDKAYPQAFFNIKPIL